MKYMCLHTIVYITYDKWWWWLSSSLVSMNIIFDWIFINFPPDVINCDHDDGNDCEADKKKKQKNKGKEKRKN